MNETLSHSNRIEIPYVPLQDTAIASTAVGTVCGIVAGLIWNPQVGAEVGIGVASTFGGLLLGIDSSNKAAELAGEGRKVRALLKALESTLKNAIGLAGAGATAGFGVAGPEGVIWGAAIGAFISIPTFGQYNARYLAEAFRQRRQISGNIALS